MASPLFLEFEYGATARPVDCNHNADRRRLAVGFVEVVGRNVAGETVCGAGFRGSQPRPELVCGLGRNESWGGAWSDGGRSCFLLDVAAGQEPVTLEIRHVVYTKAAPTISTRVRANGVDLGELALSGGAATLELPPEIMRAGALNRSLDPDSAPEISMVIVNYDRPHMTRHAVLAALASPRAASIEIIVVDNGSSPKHLAELEAMDLPVRLLRLRQNLHFGEGNNLAAEQARGQYLLLLNNDAFVTGGLPDLLHATLREHPEIGAAGPVFYFPDGVLQEAGATFQADGRAVQRGGRDRDFDLAALPELDTVRYISAACLMLRTADFISLGGFDPLFEPAYYEDTDLCQRLAALGKSTVLVKRALTFHVLNATTRDNKDEAGKQALHHANRLRFASRWGDSPAALKPEPAPPRLSGAMRGAADCLLLFPARPAAGAAARSQLATAVALGRGAAVRVAVDPVSSSLHLRQLAFRLGLPPLPVRVAEVEELASATPQYFVLSSAEPLPAHAGPGQRNILHCPYPLAATSLGADELRRRLANLAGYERLITDSALGRDAWLEQLRQAGAPKRRVEVILPPVDTVAASSEAPLKENLIVGIADYSSLDAAHEATLQAFAAFRAAAVGQGWRLVLCGNLVGADAAAAYERIAATATAAGARALLDPPPAALDDLLCRAKVCIMAGGLGFHNSNHQWLAGLSQVPVIEAVARGCVPVVHTTGPAFEACERLGLGLHFTWTAELAGALAQAAAQAGSRGLRDQHRRRVLANSWQACENAWRCVLAGKPSTGRRKAVARGTSPAAISPAPREAPSHALVVIGSHRSGTSAMARTLALAGAALPARLMAAQPDNPTGFWEPDKIVALNDRIIKEHGSSWDDVLVGGMGFRSELPGAELMQQARQELRLDYAGGALIVLKDPRISLLTPLWDSALLREGYQAHYLIMVRPPLESADSMQARNGMPRLKGLLLSAAYLLAAERNTRGLPRQFVAYASLLAEPRRVLGRIGSQFGLSLSGAGDAEEIEQFLRPELHHHHSHGGAPMEADLRPLQSLYTAALAACDGSEPEAEAFDRAGEWMRQLMAWIEPLIVDLRRKKKD